MTRVDVTTFAHEADEYLDSGNQPVYAFSFDELQRAFEAVAANESEVCAKICDKWSASLSSIPAREIRARATTPTPKETS